MNKKFKFEPLVSIIMNCYNGENYLRESINSILLQTYSNWELIFWDNKSEDKSAKIFKSYQDKRFCYFHANKHTSLYEARNLAIEKARGDFITFLDTDDMWSKEKLDKQMDYFKDESVGVVYTNFWLIKKNINKKKINNKKKLPSGIIYDQLINNYNIGAILTAVIKKEYYLKLEKKFDKRFSIIGDFDLFLRLSKICVFKAIQEPLAFYRLHGKNLSITNKNKEIEEINIWFNENKKNLSELQIKKMEKSIYNRKFINFKIEGNYKECLAILFNVKKNLLNIKNLIIFFLPVFILKKLLWYHQD